MVRCCVDGCNSRTKTSKNPPDLVLLSLHSFSQEKERRERCFINTGRKDLQNLLEESEVVIFISIIIKKKLISWYILLCIAFI